MSNGTYVRIVEKYTTMYHAINVNICTNFEDSKWLEPINDTFSACSRNFRMFFSKTKLDHCIWWRHINIMIFVFDMSNNDDYEKCCRHIMHNKHQRCKKIMVGIESPNRSILDRDIHLFCNQHAAEFIQLDQIDKEQWNIQFSNHVLDFIQCISDNKCRHAHRCFIC